LLTSRQAYDAHQNNDDETCQNICAELLLNHDLPIFFTAGSHMMLATFDENSVYHGRKAVEIFELMAAENPGEGRHAERLAAARSILKEAEAFERSEGTSGSKIFSLSNRKSLLMCR
jgi:predicted NBD/HSP70 family sugar kinase